jgi:hypothetical protein
MNDTGDIGKENACVLRQSLVGALLGRVPDELRHRFTFHGRGTLNLVVQIWVEAKASHPAIVSHVQTLVVRRRHREPEQSHRAGR